MADGDGADELRERLQRVGDCGVLRFITCGSVDDGKSTLIGRLLFDSKLLFEDQIRALEHDSRKYGTGGHEIDFALLVDGLEAEREQGITIDVAYRFFNTEKRKFIVADTPGHEQYTRNMATGASTADLAIILVDARKGLLTQTRRHTYIANMLGIRHAVLAVNKMDLIDHSRSGFHQIVSDYMALAEDLSFASITAIPISARYGDNIFQRSKLLKWYNGPTLMEHLDQVEAAADDVLDKPFRFPVQWVNRPNLDVRGFSGTVTGGRLRSGGTIRVAHSGKEAVVSRIMTADGDLDRVNAGEAVTLVLDREIDITRGDMLVEPNSPSEVSDQFAAEILWMAEEKMHPGRSYLLKSGSQTTPASVTALKHKLNINTFKKEPAKSLDLNEIGICTLSTSKLMAFDRYKVQRETGAFILIDRFTNQTVAAGMIDFSLRRASNTHTHVMDVNKARRAELKGQKPAVLWFTGLSGAGKSTIANLVECKLARNGRHTYSLDGDNVRQGLNRDLGFTDADRVENIRRIGEVAKLFLDSGLIVTCSFISPFRSERQMIREQVERGEFIEIFVDAPIEVCIERDPKGLYAKAQAGKIDNFTGIDSTYEPPDSPDLHIRTSEVSAETAAETVIDELVKRGLIG
ncbi:MAG: adenylyl-sulfate kinase [Hyphobacterium sp.]|nr:MAG: adenylyl-sulfate kinase [Hyphobacterium sp.]